MVSVVSKRCAIGGAKRYVWSDFVSASRTLTPTPIDTPINSRQVFEIVSFLPLLEDLSIIGRGLGYSLPAPRPQTSPPLTGILSLNLSHGMKRTMDSLLGLPNGIHFRRFVCTRHIGVHFQYMTTLMEACSHTLESIDIGSRSLRESRLLRDTNPGLNVH